MLLNNIELPDVAPHIDESPASRLMLVPGEFEKYINQLFDLLEEFDLSIDEFEEAVITYIESKKIKHFREKYEHHKIFLDLFRSFKINHKFFNCCRLVKNISESDKLYNTKLHCLNDKIFPIFWAFDDYQHESKYFYIERDGSILVKSRSFDGEEYSDLDYIKKILEAKQLT